MLHVVVPLLILLSFCSSCLSSSQAMAESWLSHCVHYWPTKYPETVRYVMAGTPWLPSRSALSLRISLGWLTGHQESLLDAADERGAFACLFVCMVCVLVCLSVLKTFFGMWSLSHSIHGCSLVSTFLMCLCTRPWWANGCQSHVNLGFQGN